MKYEFFVERSRAGGSVRLAICVKDEGGGPSQRGFVQPFTIKTFPPGEIPPEDEVFVMSRELWNGGDHDVRAFLQAAADAAWDEGIRPSQAKDLAGEISAVRYHLEDMRTLALRTPESAK